VSELCGRWKVGGMQLIDVRSTTEFRAGHIPGGGDHPDGGDRVQAAGSRPQAADCSGLLERTTGADYCRTACSLPTRRGRALPRTGVPPLKALSQFCRVPGTYVPGFAMTPLRGSVRFYATSADVLLKRLAAKSPELWRFMKTADSSLRSE